MGTFKVTGKLEGKHRILWENGKQEVADDAKLRVLQKDHAQISSQAKFPSEIQQEAPRTGNAIYDAAIEGMAS